MKTLLSLIMALGAAALVTAQVATENTDPKAGVVLHPEVNWGPLNPARGDKGPKAGALWSDRTETEPSGFLVEFTDGFASPPHIHNVTYRGVVISGLVHNDDPDAEPMWMPPGSFWIQPAGEVHITAAKGKSLVYVEIEKGPYLVLPEEEAFDKGQRPVNVDASNIIWQDASNTTWISPSATGAEISYLWGNPQKDRLNGTFVKLPAGFSGKLQSQGSSLRAIVIKGQPEHKVSGDTEAKNLEPGAYFGSDGEATHELSIDAEECLIYLRSAGEFEVIGTSLKK